MKRSFLILVCFLQVNYCFSQAGELDSTFGINGVASYFTTFGGALSCAILDNGKIVLGGSTGAGSGDFSVVCFNGNGILDSTFGDNGITTTIMGIGSDAPNGMAIQSDSKILEAGYCRDFNGKWSTSLVRFNSNGTLDSTFSADGKVIITFNTMGYSDGGWAVAVQSDAKIIEVGYGFDNSLTFGFAVARFNGNGSLDNTFGSGGKVLTPIGNAYPYATCVAIQPDNKILVGGYSMTLGGAPTCFALVRYNIDGSLDNTFGTGGKVTTYFGAGGANGNSYDDDQGLAIALQSDGKIVMTGYSFLGSNTSASIPIVRYNVDGSLDNSFGINGRVQILNDSFGYSVSSIALQQDNKILIGGSAGVANGGLMLSRYNLNGILDSSFGTNGFVINSINSMDDAHSIVLQQDGKIIAAGRSVLGFTGERYLSGLNVGILNLSLGVIPLLIYPNPIQSDVTLQYSLTNAECLSISLYNTIGMKVQAFISNETRTIGKHQEQLHLDDVLPAGDYILSISNGVHSQSIKIVKQ